MWTRRTGYETLVFSPWDLVEKFYADSTFRQEGELLLILNLPATARENNRLLKRIARRKIPTSYVVQN